MIMRHPNCSPEFTIRVAEIFSECRIAYVVDTQQPVTILPAATEQEGVTLMEAIEEFRQSGLRGTEVHLRKAAELINKGLWPDSVRESIHAVESIARQLAPAESRTLRPALASLEKAGQLHPALKKAFSSLYGYTSDEEGIRHPLIANPTSPHPRGYNIQPLFRILPQHTVALRCAKSLELPQNGFLRGNQPYVSGEQGRGSVYVGSVRFLCKLPLAEAPDR